MTTAWHRRLWCVAPLIVVAALQAADIKVDLSKERVGRPPTTFEPMVGTWVIAAGRRREGRHGGRAAVGGQQGQPHAAAH